MFEHVFYVSRSGEPDTGALVKFASPEREMTDEKALTRVRAAVTKWVKSTKKGAALWDYSSEDLNVGDLAGSEDSVELALALREQGIFAMSIETGIASGSWKYDSVLVNRSELDGD